jgi:hypothetical protein
VQAAQEHSDFMEDISANGPKKYPIENNPWDMILNCVSPAKPGCELQATERIFERLGDGMFRPERLIKLKSMIEQAIQKSLEHSGESLGPHSIHFRVLVSQMVKVSHFPSAGKTAEFPPPGCGIFLVQMMGHTAWETQTPPRLDGEDHGIWLYIYSEGGPAR